MKKMLNRQMTRDEAAAMLVRFLGAEDEAAGVTRACPFVDAPDWARGVLTPDELNNLREEPESFVTPFYQGDAVAAAGSLRRATRPTKGR